MRPRPRAELREGEDAHARERQAARLTLTERCSYILDAPPINRRTPRMSAPGAFKDVIKRDRAPSSALPVDEFLAELDRFIDAHNPYRQNKVVPAIGDGTASLDVVKRYAMELYYLGLWMTPEFPLLIANAPDADAFTMEDSEHYAHWAQNFADETGYLRDPNHVLMKVEYTRALGIPDEELRGLRADAGDDRLGVHAALLLPPLVRGGARARFGYARERVAGHERLREDALRWASEKHYGVKVKNLEVHAYAEQEHGDKALELMQRVCITARRPAARAPARSQHTILTNEWRTWALNRWLDEK